MNDHHYRSDNGLPHRTPVDFSTWRHTQEIVVEYVSFGRMYGATDTMGRGHTNV